MIIKVRMFSKKIILFTGLFLFLFLLSSGKVSASTLYLSPASGNIAKNGTLSVQVRLNTAGESINAVSSYLSYPSDKIEVTSISFTSSSFGIEAEKSYGGGSIRVTRGNITGVSGNVNIATIGFKGKSEGTALVSFIAGSAAVREADASDSLNLSASAGGSYKVVLSSAVADTDKKDTAIPVISDVSTYINEAQEMVITWKTDEGSDSSVDYGLLDSEYSSSTSSADMVTDHSIVIQEPFSPGLTYHFRVRSKDATGNIAEGNDSVIKIPGNVLSIKVADNKENPYSNISVTLFKGEEAVKALTTNESGEVVFDDLLKGKYIVVAKSDRLQETIEVDVSDSPSPQAYAIKASRSFLPSNISSAYPYIGFAGMLFLGMIFVFIKRILGRRKNMNIAPLTVQESMPENEQKVMSANNTGIVFNSSINENKDENLNINAPSEVGVSFANSLSEKQNAATDMNPAEKLFSSQDSFQNPAQTDSSSVNPTDALQPPVSQIFVEGPKKDDENEDISDFAAKPEYPPKENAS